MEIARYEKFFCRYYYQLQELLHTKDFVLETHMTGDTQLMKD